MSATDPLPPVPGRRSVKGRVLAGAAGAAGAVAVAGALAFHVFAPRGASAQAVSPTAPATPAPGPAATATARAAARQARVDQLLDDVAKRLNTTRDNVRNALAGAEKDAIQQRVQDGTLTQDQANRLTQRIDQGGPFLLPGAGLPARIGPGQPAPVGRPGLGRDVVVNAVASATGYTAQEVRDQLSQGKSLVDVGASKGKTQADLKTAIQTALRQRLDARVAAGTITQDQANRIFDRASAGLDRLLTNRPGAFRRAA
jgi:hypothetical protein